MMNTRILDAPPPRTARHVLQETRALVEPAIQAVIDQLPEPMRRVVGYHAGWSDPLGRPHTDDSKRGEGLHSALALATARAVLATKDVEADGQVLEEALDAAVAVELVHDFSQLHDDVMDGDEIRRHRPASWVTFGVGRTVLAGDLLLIKALGLLESGPAQQLLEATVTHLCIGQSADLDFERRDHVTMRQCLAMTAGKTAALLSCACELGAMAAGATGDVSAALGRFGWHLGMAFQLVDDVSGLWGDPRLTGKNASGDLLRRKKTLPVVAAMAARDPFAQELGRMYARLDSWSSDDVIRASHLIELTGARIWAKNQAHKHLYKALDALAEAQLARETDVDLHLLADLVVRRHG